MRAPVLIVALLLAFGPVAGRAEVQAVADSDQWIAQALKDITEGRTDDFARNYARMIDKADAFEGLAAALRVLQRSRPAFVEKAWETKAGTALREVIYVALYGQADYIYFRFVIKRHRNGWLVSHFEFKPEPGQLFPRGFISPQP
jgi:hypothetical protein